MFWIACGVLTALVTGMIVHPLRRNHRFLALALTILCPLAVVALYLFVGNPELAK